MFERMKWLLGSPNVRQLRSSAMFGGAIVSIAAFLFLKRVLLTPLVSSMIAHRRFESSAAGVLRKSGVVALIYIVSGCTLGALGMILGAVADRRLSSAHQRIVWYLTRTAIVLLCCVEISVAMVDLSKNELFPAMLIMKIAGFLLLAIGFAEPVRRKVRGLLR